MSMRILTFGVADDFDDISNVDELVVDKLSGLEAVSDT